MSGTPEYETWLGIKSRCCNKVDPAYESYGGRGITICDSWKRSFGNFLRDMGPRPSPSLSIDRINNDEGYSPENCRWATRKTQSRNTRSNTTLVVGGEALTIAEWSEKTGVKAYNISQRICKLGWSPEKAVSTPERHQSRRSS